MCVENEMSMIDYVMLFTNLRRCCSSHARL